MTKEPEILRIQRPDGDPRNVALWDACAVDPEAIANWHRCHAARDMEEALQAAKAEIVASEVLGQKNAAGYTTDAALWAARAVATIDAALAKAKGEVSTPPIYDHRAEGWRVRSARPVTARSANDRDPSWPIWYVTDDGRVNVLSGPGGAVFTSRRTAEAVAAAHNARIRDRSHVTNETAAPLSETRR